ncbi:MAG: hypothetical protein VB082_02675 [Christensenella sp.]|nr:hypothetical protein [Christensenella sp.]
MKVFTKNYRSYGTVHGFSFAFFCDVCGKKYQTPLVVSASYEEALDIAQKEARRYFNRCRLCGRWVCDHDYREDVMLCIKCAEKR